MDLQSVISHAIVLFGKSVGVWIAVWAVRSKAEWDYRLSATAKAVRWAMVAIGYLLAGSVPGPRFVRVILALIGLCFLCWPNLAYHLSKLFAEWHSAEGRIISTAQSNEGLLITYAFQVGDEAFGGNARVRADDAANICSQGQIVEIAYDPLNPDQSKFVRLRAVDTV